MRRYLRILSRSIVLIPWLATCGGSGTEPVIPAVPVGMQLIVAPAESIPDHAGLVPAPEVQVVDEAGEPVAEAGIPIAVQPTSAQLTLVGCGAPRLTDTAGVATFAGCGVQGLAGPRALKFTSAGLPDITRAVTITPGAPASIGVSVTPPSAAVGSIVPPLTVWLADSSSNKLAGRTFAVSVTTGGGSVTDTVVSDLTGNATISGWKLDTLVGANVIAITAVGTSLNAAYVQVTGAPGIPTVIQVDTTWVGPLPIDTTLLDPIRVRVRDQYGNRVVGLAATFAIIDIPGGGGTGVLPGGAMTLDQEGEAVLPFLKTQLGAGRYQFVVGIGPGNSGWYRLGGYTLRPGSATNIWAMMTPSLSAVGVPIIGGVWVTDKGGNQTTTPVAVTIIEGNGSAYVDTTTYPGESWRAIHWTYGAPGPQTVRLTVAELPDAYAQLTGFAVAPAAIELAAGDGQTGIVGALLPTKPAFRVVDSAGNGVDSVPLTIRFPNGDLIGRRTGGGGYVTIDGVTFPGPPGSSALRATSPWVPGDTAALAMLSTRGPFTGFTPLAATQAAQVATPIDSIARWRARDANGYGVPGVAVHFSATSGSFAVDSLVTDSTGDFAAPLWTPDTLAGEAIVTVTSGAAHHEQRIFVLPGPAVALSLAPDFPPVGFAGEQVKVLPRIRAKDQYGNVVYGDSGVTGQITAGGGSVGAFRTQLDGYIVPISWVLGGAPGYNELQVTMNGHTISIGLDAPAPSPFNIVLRGVDELSAPAFHWAVYQWRRRITADIPDVTVAIGGGQCTPFQESLNGTVDDLVIDVSIGAIDGPGGILGGASPCFIRTTGKLPLLGWMQFDDADLQELVADGTLGDVILHEMGHVLGVGSLWSTFGYVANAGTANPQFIGTNARTGWAEIGGTALGVTTVPVENMGGQGTRDVHWRESVMPSELMTGYLSAAVNPMSIVTIRSLVDLGYAVDLTSAEPYTVMTAPSPVPGRPPRKIQDVVERPRFTVDDNGKVRPVE